MRLTDNSYELHLINIFPKTEEYQIVKINIKTARVQGDGTGSWRTGGFEAQLRPKCRPQEVLSLSGIRSCTNDVDNITEFQSMPASIRSYFHR